MSQCGVNTPLLHTPRSYSQRHSRSLSHASCDKWFRFVDQCILWAQFTIQGIEGTILFVAVAVAVAVTAVAVAVAHLHTLMHTLTHTGRHGSWGGVQEPRSHPEIPGDCGDYEIAGGGRCVTEHDGCVRR
eukprot:gene15357-biopygen9709